MATRDVYEWSTIDASNLFPSDEGGWAEGMMRSNVNNSARANMGSVRRWYDDAEWLNLTVDATITRISATQLDIVGQDDTQYFTAGRRVRITGGTPTPVYATVVSSVFGDPDTQVVLNEFSGHTGVPTTPTLVELHIASFVSSQVFLDDIFTQVTTLTSTAIQEAIDVLEAGVGGIIVLNPQATYVCDSTISIGLGTSGGNIRIMGRGAILESDVAFDDEILRIGTGSANDTNCIVDEVIFDSQRRMIRQQHTRM